MKRFILIESLERRALFAVAADVSQLVFGDVLDGVASASRTVTFSNTAATPLTIPADGFSVRGPAASQFQIISPPATNTTLAPGASLQLGVRFNAAALGPQGATLNLLAGDGSTTSVALRGLGTKGEQGDLEPSLQWILDTYQIQSRTGDSDPAESTLDTPATLPNDEIVAPLFTRAGPGPVTIVPIAVYSNAASPALTLGYYTKSATSSSITKKQLYTVPSPDVQTLNPRVIGTSSFDPSLATFGLYSTWAAQNNRTVYSEDARNTFISGPAALQRMFKVFPLTSADGTVVPNAYVIGNEEAFNHDYQDAVYIIRNVVPQQSFPATPPPAQVSGLVLVNADTGTDVGPLENGATIDFSQIGTNHLSVRALVWQTPASVTFVDGTFSHIENTAPYTINGDSGGSYTAWTPALGPNTLTVTSYSAANAGGKVNAVYTVSFNVRLDPPPAPAPAPAPAPTPDSTDVVADPAPPPAPESGPTPSPDPTPAPAPTPSAPVVYEAEQATLKGAIVARDNAGYTGGGYADFQNNSGDSIRWDVIEASAGTYTLTFRYANGSAANRALALVVNGVTLTPKLDFTATGSWTTWKTVSISVALASGSNSITLSTTGSNGANVDSLTVV